MSKYLISKIFQENPWKAAEICDDLNMALLSLETEEEHNLVAGYLNSTGECGY
jgi:hypothetical protein